MFENQKRATVQSGHEDDRPAEQTSLTGELSRPPETRDDFPPGWLELFELPNRAASITTTGKDESSQINRIRYRTVREESDMPG